MTPPIDLEALRWILLVSHTSAKAEVPKGEREKNGTFVNVRASVFTETIRGAIEELTARRARDAEVEALVAAAHRAEVSFNTVRGCYERNPGNFMLAMNELEQDVLPLRAALANLTGATP